MKNKTSNRKSSRDIRTMRPVVIRDKSSSQLITLQNIERININECEVSFSAPNNISIFVSIAKKELLKSKDLYKTLILDKTNKSKLVDFKDRDLTKLYNYLEHIQTSIICLYTAIEALANVAIPNDYEYKTKNSKGVSETWNKESIERWFKTSDKYTKLIPAILEIEPPNTKNFWSKFKELEAVRNEIIHQKTSIKKPTDVNSDYLHKLLKSQVFEIIESGFELISYVSNSDQTHTFFPLGFGAVQMKITEVDSFTDSFDLVREAGI